MTVGEELLQNSSTAAIEQNLNKLPQFTPAKTPQGGGDIQPTATNTPGAATVSLRGWAPNRNLVLLDGRRATPSNAAGVVDINTLALRRHPARRDHLGRCSSATYGAGRRRRRHQLHPEEELQGSLEADGQISITDAGDGLEYQLSGIMGSDFDDGRGNVSIAMSLNTRETAFQRNRSWYRDLWADPNIATNRFFPLHPGIALGSGNAPSNAVFYNTLFPGTTNLGVGGFPAPQTTPPAPPTASRCPTRSSAAWASRPDHRASRSM